MSLIGEDGGKCVRMAHLATVGSHAVNGVAALHSELLKASVLKDFYELWPERFGNVTNGVTPRRFLALSNPGLRELLDETIGDGWLTDLDRLRGLEAVRRRPPPSGSEWRDVKRANKARLARIPARDDGRRAGPDLDVRRPGQADSRVQAPAPQRAAHHHAVQPAQAESRVGVPPRAFIFGGKAAPGYFMAKRIIKLINAVGETVNTDPDVNRFMKVVFVPNFNVQNAHLIYPAANLSEQISTAGKEASGTGNMKFMINGALTIGTLDGANVEIREEAGAENFFLFGLTEDEVERSSRRLPPGDYIDAEPRARRRAGPIAEGHSPDGDTEILRPVLDYAALPRPVPGAGRLPSYVDCQDRVSAAWQDAGRVDAGCRS